MTEYLDHFRLRVVQEALTVATAEYWRRRASAFEGARSRAADFTGQAAPEQYVATDERLAAIARACRYRATVTEVYGLGLDIQREIFVELAQVAA
jgi:hypothetical protein